MAALTFVEWQQANQIRNDTINPNGEQLPAWFLALGACGEMGELANVLKKLQRERLVGDVWNHSRNEDLHGQLREEIGGVLTYLALLASRLDLSLEECAEYEFNRVSEKVGYPHGIRPA